MKYKTILFTTLAIIGIISFTPIINAGKFDLDLVYSTTNFNINYTEDTTNFPNDAVEYSEVTAFGTRLENLRSEYISYGFSSPDEADVYVFEYNRNGFGGHNYMEISSYFLGNTFYGGTSATDVEELTVPGHELLHVFQYHYLEDYSFSGPTPRKWILEGNARMMQDKLYTLTDESDGTDHVGYYGQVNALLRLPSANLLEMSYNAALFWTHVAEQYGSIRTEPNLGVDVIVEFWEAAKSLDGFTDEIAVFNEMLTKLGHASVTFEDVFYDYVLSLYCKDLTGPNVPDKYMYIDETQTPGNFGALTFTIDETPADGDSIGGQDMIKSWAPKFYRYKRDYQSTDMIQAEVNCLSEDELFIALLLIKDGDIVEEYREVDTHFARSLSEDVDEVVLVVAGLDNTIVDEAKYYYSISAGNSMSLEILDPVERHEAYVGSHTDPGKFHVAVEVLDGANPVLGLTHEDFDINIGPVYATVVDAVYVKGLYFLEVQAPAQANLGTYTLYVESDYATDMAVNSVIYADNSAIDSVIVIDRSASMSLDDKLEAAQAAARLYVNSYTDDSRIALVQYNEDAQLLEGLATISGNRITLLNAIDGISYAGWTSIGDGLLAAQNELYTNGVTANPDHVIILTDGKENRDLTISEVAPVYYPANNQTTLDVVLIGLDAQDELLDWLAEMTGGKYFPTFDPSSGWLTSYLADSYRYTAERNKGEQRVYSRIGDETGNWAIRESIAIDSASTASIVFNYRGTEEVDVGSVKLNIPGGSDLAPSFTRVKQSGTSSDYFGHLIWHIPNPTPGTYVMNVTGSGEIEYLIEAGLRGFVTMEDFYDTSGDNKHVGGVVPIQVSLADNGPILGANVVATVSTGISFKDIDSWNIPLYDDGSHGDGIANDGVYGNYFTRTAALNNNGSIIPFNVKTRASGFSSLSGYFKRETFGGFVLLREPDYDSDGDGLPDVWEYRQEWRMDIPTNYNGADGDSDRDGMPNTLELEYGTSPLNSDTDGGGESDLSEYWNARDPCDASDDTLIPPMITSKAGNGEVTIYYYVDQSVTSLELYRSNYERYGYSLVTSGIDPAVGSVTDGSLTNGQLYYYKMLVVGTSIERSGFSSSTASTPKNDPVAPWGNVFIEYGAQYTNSTNVQLTFLADSDVDDIRISNDPSFEGVFWRNYEENIAWVLDDIGLQYVYVQFRDTSGNVGGFMTSEGTPSSYSFAGIIVDPDYIPTPTEPTSPRVSRSPGYTIGTFGLLVITLVIQRINKRVRKEMKTR